MRPDWIRRAVFVALFLAVAIPTWMRKTPPKRWHILLIIFVGCMLILSWNMH